MIPRWVVLLCCAIVLPSARCALAQTGRHFLHGTVRDENGGVIAGAHIAADCGRAGSFGATSQADGTYRLNLPARATCQVHVSAANFVASSDRQVAVPQTGATDFTLTVEAAPQKVIVDGRDTPLVGVDPDANVDAIVLGKEDLESLPDDPDDLMEALEALAGPTPSGGVQLYTDGFTATGLPPKAAMKEVRVNQNPYSAEYDHVGFGRIDILTRPGSDSTHGEVAYRINDAALNSRNPFSALSAPYDTQLVVGSIGGPLTERLSYFVDFQDRLATDNAVVNAQALDASLQPVPLRQTLLVPRQNLVIGGRLDLQLSGTTNLTGRFEYDLDSATNTGMGGFVLGTAAFNSSDHSLTAQLSATSALNRTTSNALHFQYRRLDLSQQPLSTAPTIEVLNAFVGGGSANGAFAQKQSLYELQDYLSRAQSAHTLTFGLQSRIYSFENSSSLNFNGDFIFSGGMAPVLGPNYQPILGPSGLPLQQTVSSLQRYQRTVMLEAAGLTTAQVRSLGGGASQYILASGAPSSSFYGLEFGAFAQDDWRLSPRLTVSTGLRWEGDSMLHQWLNLGPRFSFAWMPAGRHSQTVLRGGSGIFFERLQPQYYVNTLRYNGVTQQRFVIAQPDFSINAVPGGPVAATGTAQTIDTISPSLRLPYLIQSSVSVERKLPGSMVAAVTFASTLGTHLFYSANVPSVLGTGNNYQFQSGGSLNETQLTFSFRRKYRNGLALFGNYTWTHARDNADGPLMFPVNQNDIAAEYGRAATDIHHYAVVNAVLPGLLGTTIRPYLIIRSGAPFNIMTGHDNNGDSIYNDRPGIATDPAKPGIMKTPYGLLDPFPASGERLLARNAGQGPAFAEMNLRISRVFALHSRRNTGSPPAQVYPLWFSIPHTPTRAHVTMSVTAHNLINRDNRGLPTGNMSSPFFNQSNTLSSATDPALAAYGNNRRIQFDVRFTF